MIALHLSRTVLALGFLLGVNSHGFEASESTPSDEGERLQVARTAAARALFTEARQLANSGDYAQACPKFEESLRLVAGIGTRFNLADCWQQVGRMASAWTMFMDVVSEARASGQTERADVARARATQLEPLLSHVVVEVSAPVPGQQVFLGGVELGPAAWSTAWPADEGERLLVARAPGYRASQQRVQIVPGKRPVRFRVPALQPVTATQQRATSRATGRQGEHAPEEDEAVGAEPSSERGNLLQTLGVASLAVAGGVGAGLGGYFFLQRNVANGEAKRLCRGGDACTAGEIDAHARHIDDVSFYESAATWSFILGGASLVGAAVWYFAGSDATDRDAASSVRVVPLEGGLEVHAVGHW